MRADDLYKKLTQNTVLGNFLEPALLALEKVRYQSGIYSALPMPMFLLVGCLRHLHGMRTLREQVQMLFHSQDGANIPVARSTYSDALASNSRLEILHALLPFLVQMATELLPDRLAEIPGLGKRRVLAVDGTYEEESSHFRRRTPRDGGNDNPKGHMVLGFFDVRLGCPVDARVETKNRHEIAVFKDLAKQKDELVCCRHTLWLDDRGFVDMPFWDQQKKHHKQTTITRLKDNLIILSAEHQTVSRNHFNKGVDSDEKIQLKASKDTWRLIRYRDPQGNSHEFLTNEMTLEPGVVAFLYLRRWDTEKCFDTWKNDFSNAKGWGKSITAITNQNLLAVITTLLVQIFISRHQKSWGIGDEKCLDRQKKHREKNASEKRANRIPWYVSCYRYTAKISRQVIRFLKNCYSRIATPILYEAQLKPLLLQYL